MLDLQFELHVNFTVAPRSKYLTTYLTLGSGHWMTRLKKSERRSQIIENAIKVFAECGLAGARTRRIADACGVNEALIYKHFKSKKELFRAAMADLHARLIANWQDTAEKACDGRTALEEILKLQTWSIYNRPETVANIVHGLSAAMADERMREMIQGWTEQQHRFVVGILKRGIADGSLRADLDPERASWWLRGLGWTSIIINALGLPDSLPEQSADEMYIQIIECLAGKDDAWQQPE